MIPYTFEQLSDLLDEKVDIEEYLFRHLKYYTQWEICALWQSINITKGINPNEPI